LKKMKTKIFYTILIGLCFMLTGMKSSAQDCNLTITVDAWTLNISDNSSGHTYTATGQVLNSNKHCFSDEHIYGTSYTIGPNSMPQYAYEDNHDYNDCTYCLRVIVKRDDDREKVVFSAEQLPDINYHISPGTLYVTFD